MTRSLLRFGTFEVDLDAGELRKADRQVRIQQQPLHVLKTLLQRPGEVVTREELRQALWPADTFVDFERGLNAAVNRLRTALGDDAENPRFIETLERRGYRFIAPVVLADAISSSSAVAPASGEPALSQRSATPKRLSRRQVGGIAAALLILAGAVVGVTRGVRQKTESTGEPPRRIRSLAVLPLDNLSGDPQEDYFADGITDALITELARSDTLRIISRQSVMRYKGSRKGLAEIARDLDADALVLGTVLRSGARVRVTAQLIDGRTDAHLWSERYERDLQDVLKLEADVASAVARQVSVNLAALQGARSSVPSVDPEAHEEYLRGRYQFEKRSKEGLEKAIAHLRRAIERDPSFARAWSGLADAYNLLSALAGIPPAEGCAAAEAAASRALELDDGLADAHRALAWISFTCHWDWRRAEAEFQRARALGPSDFRVHSLYPFYLLETGRPCEEALSAMRPVREMDPVSPTTMAYDGLLLYYCRRYDEAVEHLSKALDLERGFVVGHLWLGRTYLMKQDYARAVAEFQQAQPMPGDSLEGIAELAHAHGVAGRRDQARKLLAVLERTARERYVSPYDLALVHIGLGEREDALKSMEEAYRQRAAGLRLVKVDPRLDPLRPEPRFQALIERMGLPR